MSISRNFRLKLAIPLSLAALSSAGLGVWFLQKSLDSSTKELSHLLYAQMASDFASEDLVSLSRRLNGLSQFPHIVAIHGSRAGAVFFEYNASGGGNRFFLRDATISKGVVKVTLRVGLRTEVVSLAQVLGGTLAGLSLLTLVLGITFEKQQHLVDKEIATAAAALAHDIRAPMFSIDAVIGHPSLSEEIRKLLELARQRMDLIASDLLDRFASVSMDPGFVDVLGPLRRAVSRVQAAYPGLHFLFSQNTGGSDEVRVFGQSRLFERIFFNLLENAAQASKNGDDVEIGYRFSAKNQLNVSIKDSGRGIEPELLRDLNHGKGRSTKQLGTGFGLWFARDRMRHWTGRGSLRICSTLGSGTEVTLIFRTESRVA